MRHPDRRLTGPWVIPEIGDLSLASVPLPGDPFNRRRQPGLLTSHGLAVALVPVHIVYPVDLMARCQSE
jgi:hypothetical protein